MSEVREQNDTIILTLVISHLNWRWIHTDNFKVSPSLQSYGQERNLFASRFAFVSHNARDIQRLVDACEDAVTKRLCLKIIIRKSEIIYHLNYDTNQVTFLETIIIKEKELTKTNHLLYLSTTISNSSSLS